MAQDSFFPARAIMKELNVSFAFVYTKADFEFTIEMLGPRAQRRRRPWSPTMSASTRSPRPSRH